MSPQEVLSVGDSEIDLMASRSAGVAFGAYLWDSDNRERLMKLNPEFNFESPNDLLNFSNQQF